MLQRYYEIISSFFAGDIAMNIYWGLAVSGTLFFVLNLIFASFGGVDNPAEIAEDGTIDLGDHVDTGLEDFNFLSLRAILAFICIFGWSGILWGEHGFWGFVISLASGLVAMSLNALVVWGMIHLQHSGNVKSKDFVGATGTVYIQIPGGAKIGKVTVTVGGSTREVAAISKEPIATGTPIKVVAVIDQSLFRVEKI